MGLALAGILVGPHVLNLIAKDSAVEFLGTIGLMYVFFVAGAEIDIAQLRRERNSSLVFYAFTFGLPFAAGLATDLPPRDGGPLGDPPRLRLLLLYPRALSHRLEARPGPSALRGRGGERRHPHRYDDYGHPRRGRPSREGGGDRLAWAKMLGAILAWALLSALLIPKAAELSSGRRRPTVPSSSRS